MSKYVEFKVTLPADDGGEGEAVALQLRPITKVPVGVLRRNRHDRELQMWDMFEWAVAPEQLELFDQLPIEAIEDLMDAWQAAGGVTAGESEASSKPSPATGRPSKQTSSATGSG